MVVPRPHWLNSIKTILETQRLSVRWKVNSGDDRTHHIFFLTDSESHSQTLHPHLDHYLSEANIATQGAWASKMPNPCVVYDIVSLEHVQWLHDHPPTIDGWTYYASQYRFVQPLFAFELTVVHCHEFQSACSTIDNYIRHRYGDVIVHSRMALDGDLYCVVFKHWETTDHFLQDPFDAFEGAMEGTLHQSAPTCSTSSILWSNQTTSALGSLAASIIASNNVNHISSHVQSLRMERNSLQLTSLLSLSLNDFTRQQLSHQVSDISSQLSAAQRQLDDAVSHSTALDHT
ncbi:hypothetical protein EV702DRAFT_1197425 [Suillus placidus]|uniref:Uncharacterized protein n=1 Tax=Suillus placidus TaxID=48579 RepID=A0A9P7D2W6_9AGAM|nr:hypothetical protein EV702DRAFT_1197425 [Suillus placidus]